MKTILIASLLAVVSAAAVAGPSCNEPQNKWMKEADFKKGLEAQGYQIKTFKVSKGQCYEIYGFDKGNKRVEIYFNPASGAVLETK